MTHDYSAYTKMGHNRPEEISEITQLAHEQHAAEIKVEELTEELKLAKERLRKISEDLLPEKMQSLGMPSFSTDEGVHVEISEKIQASISVENRPKAYSWLEENGYGGLIKSNVVVPFGRKEIEKANELVAQLTAEKRLAKLDRKVEPMTLVAFVREQLAQGKDIPVELFGVFRKRIAKVEV